METPILDIVNSPWPYVIVAFFVLGVAMLIVLLMDALSDDRNNAPLKGPNVFSQENRLLSNRQFFALVGTIGFVDWLIWIWMRIPPDARAISPMLELMNLWGFAVVAGLASFGIGMIGIHLATVKQKREQS
jgi:hypothetical protein